MIVLEGKVWVLYSSDGKRKIAEYTSKSAAVRRKKVLDNLKKKQK